MWSWNQFRNLPRNQGLSAQEQARQYFIHQSNMMMEASSNNNSAAAASSAAAGAGAGGTPASRRVTVASWVSLDSALESLNLRYSEVTALVPNIYNFWDDYTTVDDDGDIPILTGINDGGDDMYDGANYMNTNLTANWDDIKEGESDDDGDLAQASIPYTHTQASDEDDDEEYNNPPMDGQVALGDSYFGPGSMYFTNMYPGLFIMIADNISVSEFNISGNVGSDGEGIGAGYVESIVPGWTLFYKTNTDEGDEDPSINQLILVPGTSTGITQEYDTSSEYDDHRISGIDDRSRIIYAVVARQPEQDVLSEEDAVNVAQKILEIVGREVPTYNFGITANWSLTTPEVVDEASFKTFLESGEDGDGNTNSLTDVVITDFSLVGDRLRCNLTANGSEFSLRYTEVSVVNGIGNIVGLIVLYLENNQIVTFDPSTGLPSSLQSLSLGSNQIVTFDPSIALPSSLTNLGLTDNQIVTFDPTIALPSGLTDLSLGNNQIVTFDPSIALPSSLTNLGLTDNQIVTFDPSIALPSGLQILQLYNNQIVTFDPSIALPGGLQNLYLGNNQIVTFDPTIALPSGLQNLLLNSNQIVTFNPAIPLPSGLEILELNQNQMTTAGYTASEPWANAMSVIPERGVIYLGGNVNPITGTNLETILEAKGWDVNG